MIRLTLFLVLGVLGYMLYRVNGDTTVSFTFLDRTTRDLSLSLLLLYAFIAGWVVHLAFTLPGRLMDAFRIFWMKRNKRLMGEDLADLIDSAHKK